MLFTRRKFLNTLCFNLGLYIRKLAWLVICILPCVICIGVASIYSRSLGQLGVVLLYIAGIALLIAGLIAYIFISAKYFCHSISMPARTKTPAKRADKNINKIYEGQS